MVILTSWRDDDYGVGWNMFQKQSVSLGGYTNWNNFFLTTQINLCTHDNALVVWNIFSLKKKFMIVKPRSFNLHIIFNRLEYTPYTILIS